VTKQMTVGEIAELLHGRVIGNTQATIRGLAKIEEAGPEDLTFVANPKYAKYLEESHAGVVLISPALIPSDRTVIVVDDPYLCFVRLLEIFYPAVREVEIGVHASAVVDAPLCWASKLRSALTA
jgi:UDP-3-O-[3-hydroxymyristoyl] glucosamine N-acyltransferase